MSLAALHRIPTQTLDSSQVFERWVLQKKQKIINKITKCWEKNTIKDLEHVCPKKAHDFFSWLLSSKTILPWLILSSWTVICLDALYAQFLKKESRRKKLNSFKRFIFRDSDNTFHSTNFTNINAALSSNQTILPYALHSEVWSCFWMGSSSKSNFLHQRGLKLWDSRNLPKNSTSLSIKLSRILHFSVPFAKYSPFTALRRMFESSL